MNEAVQGIVESELEKLGFELVDLTIGGSKGRPSVQVRMDRTDGEKVSVDDCALASRVIEPRLDEFGQLGERYVLEVSSPGVERPLRKPDDWRRFSGRKAKVLSEQLGGRKEVEIVGLEGEPGAEVVVVRTARGEEQRVPLTEVREARLVFTW